MLLVFILYFYLLLLSAGFCSFFQKICPEVENLDRVSSVITQIFNFIIMSKVWIFI